MPEGRPSRIVLASQSPRRLELLQQIGITPEVVPADIDESVKAGENPEDYVMRMASEKAEALNLADDSLVIAADTSVVLGEEIFGKPENESDFARMMNLLSGQTHQVLTAVACRFNLWSNCQLSKTDVTFRALSAAVIEQYWATTEPVDKAGGYAIQGKGAVFVTHINGSYSGVMGLPLFETSELISEAMSRDQS